MKVFFFYDSINFFVLNGEPGRRGKLPLTRVLPLSLREARDRDKGVARSNVIGDIVDEREGERV